MQHGLSPLRDSAHPVLRLQPKKIPKTIENTREFDETVVDPDDDEVMHDQLTDELSNHLQGRPTKIMITTSVKARGVGARVVAVVLLC